MGRHCLNAAKYDLRAAPCTRFLAAGLRRLQHIVDQPREKQAEELGSVEPGMTTCSLGSLDLSIRGLAVSPAKGCGRCYGQGSHAWGLWHRGTGLQLREK